MMKTRTRNKPANKQTTLDKMMMKKTSQEKKLDNDEETNKQTK